MTSRWSVLILALSCSHVAAQDPFEPDNIPQRAEGLSVETGTATGVGLSLHTSDDVDWFGIFPWSPSITSDYVVSIDNPTVYLQVFPQEILIDPEVAPIAEFSPCDAPEPSGYDLPLSVGPPNGPVFLRAENCADAEIFYNLFLVGATDNGGVGGARVSGRTVDAQTGAPVGSLFLQTNTNDIAVSGPNGRFAIFITPTFDMSLEVLSDLYQVEEPFFVGDVSENTIRNIGDIPVIQIDVFFGDGFESD